MSEEDIPCNEDIFNVCIPSSLDDIFTTVCKECGVPVPDEGPFTCPSSNPDDCTKETVWEYDTDEVSELMFD